MSTNSRVPLATPEFQGFQDALWNTLWKVESIGLRRLARVLDQLQIAADEIATLIALRLSKEGDRQKLRGAWAACDKDMTALTREAASAAQKVRDTAAQLVTRQRAAIAVQVENYIAKLPDAAGMPRPSSVAETLSSSVVENLRGILSDVQSVSLATCAPYDSRIAASLAQLRNSIGSTLNLPGAVRLDGQTLSHQVVVPETGDITRRTDLLAAGGISATATFGIVSFLGGPVGWALLASVGVGSLVSWLADVITDRATTRSQLQAKVSAKLDEVAAKFGRRLDAALVEEGHGLSGRIRARMQPYLDDVLHRLDDIRPPTPEESAVHTAMSKEVAETRDALKAIFDTVSRDSG